MTEEPEISPQMEQVFNLWYTRTSEFFGAKAVSDALEKWADDPSVGVRFYYDNGAPVVENTADGRIRMVENEQPTSERLRTFIKRKRAERESNS